MFLAEIDHLADSGDSEARFPRTGFVIESGMKDSAVVAALMAAYGWLFFEYGDAGSGKTLAEPPRGR